MWSQWFLSAWSSLSQWSWVTTFQVSRSLLLILDTLGAALVVIMLFPWLKSVCRCRPLSWLAAAICIVLKIPIKRDLYQFTQKILTRYSNKNDAVSYMDRIIDRQINKARGILPFNSILMTINSFGLSNARRVTNPVISHSIDDIERWIFSALALSSVLLLELFWVHWSKLPVYDDPAMEVDSTARIARDRSVILDAAIVLSFAGVIGIAITTFATYARFPMAPDLYPP